MGHDGVLRILAELDDRGFGVGVNRIGSSISRAMRTLTSVIRTVRTLTSLAAIFFGVSLINNLVKAVGQTSVFGKKLGEIQNMFGAVRGAAIAAFAPLLAIAAPYIKIVTDWLVKMLNILAQVLAALAGQTTYMQYISGGAESAAGAAGDLADNTAKAGKAAKGALAAFDQLNVLQQESAKASGGGGGASGMLFELAPVEAQWIDLAGKVKEVWRQLVEDIKERWNSFMLLFSPEFWQAIWLSLTGFAANVILSVQNIFGILALWFKTNVINPVVLWWTNGMSEMKAWAAKTVLDLQNAWAGIQTWWKKYVTDPLKAGWDTTMTGMKDTARNIFNAIIGFVNGLVRAIAAGLNAIIRGLNAIKITIPAWVPIFGGSSWSTNIPTVAAPQIPMLANGAVIPPNAAFAAVLGDQRSGRNLEAPEGLIRQIMREELGKIQADVSITFDGTMAAFVRELKPRIDKESVRIGNNLAVGENA